MTSDAAEFTWSATSNLGSDPGQCTGRELTQAGTLPQPMTSRHSTANAITSAQEHFKLFKQRNNSPWKNLLDLLRQAEPHSDCRHSFNKCLGPHGVGLTQNELDRRLFLWLRFVSVPGAMQNLEADHMQDIGTFRLTLSGYSRTKRGTGDQGPKDTGAQKLSQV